MTKAVLLLGPTASGKTAVALHLARRFAVEIVSVDSAQVYRDMNVGTAKPSPEARAAVPHHLIDIAAPTEAYSAGRFRADALRLVAEISSRGNVALLAGGTMLYFRALTRGLADLPAADPSIRAEIEARAARASWPVLHAELAKVDFATAARVEPNDAQRIQRALEVHCITGRALSELQALRASEPLPFEALSLVLEPSDRAVLHRRIDERFAGMLREGLVDEVKDLRKRYRLDGGLPSMRSVGYRQVWETLEGEKPAATLAARGAAATRQLAKRQLTWLRALGGAPHGDRIGDPGGAPNGDGIEYLERLDCLRPDLADAVEARVALFLSPRRGT